MTAAVLDHLAIRTGADARRADASGEDDDPRWQIIRATLHMHPSEIATFSGVALSGNDEAAHALVADAAGWLR